jgi:hypothetical protein
VDASDVAEFVDEARGQIIEDMWDETLDRVATRYRRDVVQRESRNVEPAEANSRAREAMEDADELERLTHGKRLLASLRKRVQERYNESFGNQILIAELQEDEMDPEIWEVLKAIEDLASK